MDVVCAGILVTDVVAKPVVKFPEEGKLELVKEMRLHLGGCASNTAVDLAKLGVSTGVIGKIGRDAFGNFLIKTMQSNGLNMGGIKKDDKLNTSVTMVFVLPDGERSFIHYLGSNSTFCEKDMDYKFIKKAKIFYMAGFFLLPALEGKPIGNILKKVKQMGMTTVLDTAWDSRGNWYRAIKFAFPYTDFFLPSYEEARMISKESNPQKIGEFFLDEGVKIVGIKMGAKGSFLKTKNFEKYIPPFKINQVDATGAGDAFVAGFLAGLVKKWELEKCAELANAVGALATTGVGTTAGVKSMKETLKFIASQRKKS